MLLFADGPDAVLQLRGDEHTHNVRPVTQHLVGCMVGEMLGMFATGNGTASENKAFFRWVEYRDL